MCLVVLGRGEGLCCLYSCGHFVAHSTYRLLRTSVRKIKISSGSVLHYWSYSLHPSSGRLFSSSPLWVRTTFQSCKANKKLGAGKSYSVDLENVSKSNHKRTVIRQVITGVINSLFLRAALWYVRRFYGAQAADKVFIIIAGNPSGNSLGRDLLPPNQGFN